MCRRSGEIEILMVVVVAVWLGDSSGGISFCISRSVIVLCCVKMSNMTFSNIQVYTCMVHITYFQIIYTNCYYGMSFNSKPRIVRYQTKSYTRCSVMLDVCCKLAFERR